MDDVDPDMRAFQECIWVQNYACGAMACIGSELDSASGEVEGTSEAREKRSNNLFVVLVGHGLGGILEQAISSFALELSDERYSRAVISMSDAGIGGVVLLVTPNVSLGNGNSGIVDDLDQIAGIVTYDGRKSRDLLHTRAFWSAGAFKVPRR